LKNIEKRWCFLSKNKNNLKEYLSFPHHPLNLIKKMNKKKSPYSNEKLKKKEPSALFVCPAPEKEEKTPIR